MTNKSKKVTLAMIAAAVLVTGAAGTMMVIRNLQNRPSVYLSAPTKTSGCKARRGLPDKRCTPGTIFKTVTKNQICIPGYSKLVRHVDVKTKDEVLKRYGITDSNSKSYEIDHLVSLQLGGSNDIANLWPEAASPVPGFHEKDQVENLVHAKICKGELSLQEAAKQISANWQVYLNP